MGSKSRVAVGALIVGIACFLNLLGTEKALAAIILGWLGLQEVKQEEKAGKWMAYAGIVLGAAYIVTLAVLLIIWGPQFMEHVQKLKG